MSKDLTRLYHKDIKFSRHPPPPMPNAIRRHREEHSNYYNRESKKPPIPRVIREYRKSVKNYNNHMALECKRLGYVKLKKTKTVKPRTRKRTSNYHYREVNLNKP